MSKKKVEEAHVFDALAGHKPSRDCWCEPARVYLVAGIDGEPIRVVEHNDECSLAHREVLTQRRKTPDWITSFLDEVEEEGDES